MVGVTMAENEPHLRSSGACCHHRGRPETDKMSRLNLELRPASRVEARPPEPMIQLPDLPMSECEQLGQTLSRRFGKSDYRRRL